ncbi:MAG: SseB family protein [Pseudomonadota bacterium]
MTPLDLAHAAMMADEAADAPRAAFYAQLATTELYLLLEAEPEGDAITPRSFDLPSGTVVLAFDREDRLAHFAGGPAPYAAVSGRTLAELLAPSQLGLGLNLDVAPSSILLPADAMRWLADTTATPEAAQEARIAAIAPPHGLPEALLTALDARLAGATGLARFAALALATYAQGGKGHLLAFVGALPDAEPALRRAGAEALRFSGLEAGSLDIVFLSASHPLAEALSRTGLRFDIPQPEELAARRAPGSDPAHPPKLK